MSYAVASDVMALVQASYPNGATSSTAPTATQLTSLLAQVAAEIDVHLAGAGYDVPVTTPAGFSSWLSLVNAEGVAAIALKSLAPGATQSTNGGPVVPAYAYYEKKYQDALKLIDARTIIFPGASLGNSVLAESYITDNPDNDPFTDGSTEGQQPVFSIGHTLREF